MYDLEGSGESGEGLAGEETRQTKPALLFDAHDGKSMNGSGGFDTKPSCIVAA